MSKIIERNVAELIMIGVILLVLMTSSCQTVKEMKMTSGQRATQCNWVNR